MGKVKGKHRLDKYYHLAKEHGYRSRASWKLLQLDAKFGFLQSSHAVLDLCAAPGGWMQIAVQRVPVGSIVVGVDLVPIAPLRGAHSIQQDITRTECVAKLRRLMRENGCSAFDLVLHDGSPNVGGAWSSEATAQNSLVVDSIKLATQLLAPKGTFVTKVCLEFNFTSKCLMMGAAVIILQFTFVTWIVSFIKNLFWICIIALEFMSLRVCVCKCAFGILISYILSCLRSSGPKTIMQSTIASRR